VVLTDPSHVCARYCLNKQTSFTAHRLAYHFHVFVHTLYTREKGQPLHRVPTVCKGAGRPYHHKENIIINVHYLLFQTCMVMVGSILLLSTLRVPAVMASSSHSGSKGFYLFFSPSYSLCLSTLSLSFHHRSLIN
jgi:hypothetical protein